MTDAFGPGADHDGFAPPKDFQFEPELQPLPPRGIPYFLREGRYARRQRKTIWSFAVLGLVLIGLGALPIMKVWGQFVLPLAYVVWIGIACLFIAGLIELGSRLLSGAFRYVEDGIPIVARVTELYLAPAVLVHGQGAAYHFVADAEYLDPDSGELTSRQFTSNSFPADVKHKRTTSFRVGDYVTAIYLPNNPEKTLQLYGFLDLNPHVGVIDVESSDNLWKSLLTVIAIPVLFFVLGWNVYAYGRYCPLELHFAQMWIPLAIGAVFFGGALIAWLVIESRVEEHKRRALNERSLETGGPIQRSQERDQGWSASMGGGFISVILIAGSLLLGGLTVLCWAFTINSLLDNSPPDVRKVEIDQLVVSTRYFIFREFTIEYHFPGEAETHTLMSTPEQMEKLAGLKQGRAHVHAGRLGWPWVKSIER